MNFKKNIYVDIPMIDVSSEFVDEIGDSNFIENNLVNINKLYSFLDRWILFFLDNAYKFFSSCQHASQNIKDKLGYVCRSCKEWQPLELFHKNGSKSSGHDSQCKKCVSERKSRKKDKYSNHDGFEFCLRETPSPKFESGLNIILDLICNDIMGESWD